MTIYEKAKKLGLEIDSRQADLHIKVTPESRKLINNYKLNGKVTIFNHHTDGSKWFDIPHRYDPFYERKLIDIRQLDD